MPTPSSRSLLPALQVTIERLVNNFENIPAERTVVLKQLTGFIENRVRVNQPVYLNFICTHNSRRSHFAQLWAHAAAHYYLTPNVHCNSGGTEATAFNPRAVNAMQEAGFNIALIKNGENPVYEVYFSEHVNPVTAFSKKYDSPFNHRKDFAAILTCSHANESCPLIPGASARIALSYEDPKEFDDHPLEVAVYTKRAEQIGTEILFAFSMVRYRSRPEKF